MFVLFCFACGNIGKTGEGKPSGRLLLKFKCEMEKDKSSSVEMEKMKHIWILRTCVVLFFTVKFELESRVFVIEVVKFRILSRFKPFALFSVQFIFNET